MHWEDCLRSSRLFRGASVEQLAALEEALEAEVVAEGEPVFHEGDPGDRLYLIIEGQIRISIQTPGQGEEALAILKAGDSFGEMSAIDDEPQPRSASAIAHRRCSLLTVTRGDLDALLERDPALGFIVMRNVVRYLSKEMRRSNQKILFLSAAGMF